MKTAVKSELYKNDNNADYNDMNWLNYVILIAIIN